MKKNIDYYKNKKVELENTKNEIKKIKLLNDDLNKKIEMTEIEIKKLNIELNNKQKIFENIDNSKMEFKHQMKKRISKTVIYTSLVTGGSFALAYFTKGATGIVPFVPATVGIVTCQSLLYNQETSDLKKEIKSTMHSSTEGPPKQKNCI